MTTSPGTTDPAPSTTGTAPTGTAPTGTAPTGTAPTDAVRLELREQRQVGGVDGAWWPHSRDLRVEAGRLVDHFDQQHRRVQRLLFSRPDWDDVVTDGRGLRRILASRGPVKVGSFPDDDTHVVVLTMASGPRLTIRVVAPATPAADARRAMQAVVA